jgi:LysM repeat protein
MRTWIKSACVVLAWSILPVILMAAGPQGSARLAQANTRTSNTSIRITSSTEVVLTSTLSVAATPVTATSHTTKYVVQAGDTLSGIAARFAVRGGWPTLYAANRRAIGPDPNVVHAGTVLVLPGQRAPIRYTVVAGDTLSALAAKFAVRGGWPALYAANRRAIGPDPNVVHAGTVLTLPAPAAPSASATAPSPTKPGRTHHQHPPTPRPSPRAGGQPHARPTPRSAPAAGMPSWLKIMLLAAGLLILAAFVAEPIVVARRRRRQAPAQAARLSKVEPALLPAPLRGPCADKPHIILADHDRLVVTRSQRDDTVYVLRPPGEDPRAILRVARLVVPENRYGELAEALGMPAGWPME